MLKNKFSILLITIIIVACNVTSHADSEQLKWHEKLYPTPNEPQVYGSYTAGCMDGAYYLPETGVGYASISAQRNRNHGHPNLVNFIQSLGKQIDQEYSRKLLVGDLSHPRGGPASIKTSAHRSHQTGLDVDMWYHNVARDTKIDDNIKAISVLTRNRKALHKKNWNLTHAQTLKAIASYPEVERILVNPYVKKSMCAQYDQAPWLNKLRPWWGHHKHFHVRLKCPKDNVSCKKQEPVPSSPGCDSELQWWFSKEAANMGSQKDKEKRKYPKMPTQCTRVFEHG